MSIFESKPSAIFIRGWYKTDACSKDLYSPGDQCPGIHEFVRTLPYMHTSTRKVWRQTILIMPNPTLSGPKSWPVLLYSHVRSFFQNTAVC